MMRQLQSSENAVDRHFRIKEEYGKITPKDVHGDPANKRSQFVILISNALRNGGRAGVPCESPLELAATAIADNTHRMATPEEAGQYLSEQAEKRRGSVVRQARLDLKVHALTKNFASLAALDMDEEPTAAAEESASAHAGKAGKGK